jgi:hypothetical protein
LKNISRPRPLLNFTNHNTTTMNGPLFPPGGGGVDGADAQTMAAVRSVRSLPFQSIEVAFSFEASVMDLPRRKTRWIN